jgi:hypothetical protein
MPYEQTELYADHLPNTITDLYVPGTGEKALVQNITFHNEDSGTVNAKLYFHNGSKDLRVVNYDLTAGETVIPLQYIGGGRPVYGDRKIRGQAGTADVVSCWIDGMVKT